MDIIALRAALAYVEKAIVVGEQTIAAQRSLIAEMERSGMDARAQKQALENLKREQWRRIQRREILTQELAAEGCSQGLIKNGYEIP